MDLHCSIHGVDRPQNPMQSSHMTKRRPPARWTHLHKGDMINTSLSEYKIHNYIKELELEGYLISTDPTSRGYRLTCLKSPLDRPAKPKLRIVK